MPCWRKPDDILFLLFDLSTKMFFVFLSLCFVIFLLFISIISILIMIFVREDNDSGLSICFDYMAYMDYMVFAAQWSKKVVKLNH